MCVCVCVLIKKNFFYKNTHKHAKYLFLHSYRETDGNFERARENKSKCLSVF